MKKFFKWLLALVVLLILLVVGFVLLVDPNRFKPSIESLAKKQGVSLHIEGDLFWKFWPGIGVGVEGVSVASMQTPDKPLAKVEQMNLLLAIRPLFKGSIQSDHIIVSGADIHLLVDAQGKSNWEFLSDSKPEEPEVDADASGLDLNVRQISIENGHLLYEDQQAQSRTELKNLNVKLDQVNTQNQPFAMELSTAVSFQSGKEAPIELQIDAKNQLQVDAEFTSLNIANGKLELDIIGKKSIALPVDYSVSVKDLQNAMSYQGELNLAKISLRDLLAALDISLDTADADALKHFVLKTSFSGTADQIQLDPVTMQLDDTRLTGSVAITDFATTALKLDLKADQINLDNYLPPPAPENSTDVATAPEEPLPLDALRELNLDAKFQLGSLVIKDLRMSDVNWTLSSHKGVLDQKIAAKSYSGKLDLKNQLDARQKSAQLKFDVGVDSLQINPLMKDFFKDRDTEKFDLQGAVNVRAQGSASGVTATQLIDNLQADANFSGAELRMIPINLEQQFCHLVGLVSKTESPEKTWDAFTRLTELSGNLKLQNQKIRIESLNAGVEQLLLSSTGEIDMNKDKYDLFLPLKLLRTASSADADPSVTSCWTTADNEWLARGLNLLRCKGSLSNLNPVKDCRPDKDLLVDLTKDYAVYKLKQKHGAKVEEKKEEVKSKIDDEKAKVKDKLDQEKNRLFDRLQKKLGSDKASTSSEAATETSQ